MVVGAVYYYYVEFINDVELRHGKVSPFCRKIYKPVRTSFLLLKF